MNWLILIVAIIFNALANILIKVGMMNMNISFNSKTVVQAATSPAIVVGIVSFVCALVAYAFVLSKMNLSIAYPVMTSMGFVIVILASSVLLKETIGCSQIAGFAIIIIGVIMVAK